MTATYYFKLLLWQGYSYFFKFLLWQRYSYFFKSLLQQGYSNLFKLYSNIIICVLYKIIAYSIYNITYFFNIFNIFAQKTHKKSILKVFPCLGVKWWTKNSPVSKFCAKRSRTNIQRFFLPPLSAILSLFQDFLRF